MKVLATTFIMGILSFFCSLLGCTSSSSDEQFQSVNVEQFEQVISDSAIVRLDVRTASEYNDGHVEGALNIDVLQDTFEEKAASLLPKDRTIALYCRSGRRSKRAASILTKMGYTVVELDSGFNGWKSAGRPIAK